MATCTAQITIGAGPGGWGGEGVGIGADRIMYLFEAGRPTWVLETVRHSAPAATEPTTWVASRPERILADALVMIAVRIDGDPDVRGLIRDRLTAAEAEALSEAQSVDLGELDGERLEEIEAAARRAVRAKLVIAVMNGSSMTGQLALLEQCSMEVEVCTPSWIRQMDAEGEAQVAGELPPGDPQGHRFRELRI